MMRVGCTAVLTPLLLMLFAGAAAAGPTWARTYGGSNGEGAWKVREATDGSLLAAGYTDSFRAGNAWVLHLESDGDIISERAYRVETNGGLPPDATALGADGSVFFAGRVLVDLFTIHHAWAVQYDPDGNLVWRTKFFTPPFPLEWGRWFLVDAERTGDGGVIASGSHSQTDGSEIDPWLVKLDQDGVVEWQWKYGVGPEDAVAVVQTSDGGYAVAGRYGPGAGLGDAWIMKVDGLGAFQWQRWIGESDQEQANGLVEIPGGGYALAGWTGSFTSSGRAPWAIRLNSSGGLVWHKVFGADEWGDFQDVVVTSDGNLLFTGRIWAPGMGTNDLWVVKMRPSDGEVLWQRRYEGTQGDWGEDAAQLANGDLFVGGTWAWGFPEEEMWLLRLDANGRIPTCNIMFDTTVATTSPAVSNDTEVATRTVPDAQTMTETFAGGTTNANVSIQCTGPEPCPALSCDGITVDPPSPVCEGTSQTFTAATTGGELPVTIEWDFDGDTAADATGNPVAAALPAGASTVTTTATDSCSSPGPQSCSMQEAVLVHPDSTPTILPSGPTTFCAQSGESVVLDAGAGYASYQWALGGTDIGGATEQTYEATVSGDYTVTVTDGNGCTWTSAPVTVNADFCPCPPLTCDDLTIEPNPVCEGETQDFTAVTSGGEGAVTIRWDVNGDTNPDVTGNPIRTSLPAGDWPFTAIATDSCADPGGPQDCSITRTAHVHPDATPTITPGGPTVFCVQQGESVVLDAGAGYAGYQWLIDGTPIPGATAQTHDASVTGDYTVTVTDANGCEWTSAPLAVDAEDCPCPLLACDAVMVDPDPVCDGETQTFTAAFTGGEAPVSVAWDFDGDTSPDAAGNPLDATRPEGSGLATAIVGDSCADPQQQTCTVGAAFTVLSAAVPPDASDVLAGAPPLLVHRANDGLTVESVPGAAVYNVYADAIGSWYSPNAGTGSACSADAWTDNGDGTITLDVQLPAGSWFLVTVSTACAEGSAGRDSLERERMGIGTWEQCGPAR